CSGISGPPIRRDASGHRARSLEAMASPRRPPDSGKVIARARIHGDIGERLTLMRPSSAPAAAGRRPTAGGCELGVPCQARGRETTGIADPRDSDDPDTETGRPTPESNGP